MVLFSILYLVQKKDNGEYYSVELKNVISQIPTAFMESNESALYKGEYGFYIDSEKQSYMIFGIELQEAGENDVGKGIIADSDSLKILQNADSISQIVNGIRAGTGLLGKIEEQGSIEKPSYTMYYFSSNEVIEEKNYEAYIMFLIQGDVKYMQINIVDQDYALSDKQKKHMRLYTYCYQ